jgi:hypothetical protein
MARTRIVERAWVADIVPGEVRMRCAYRRRGNQVLEYTVQLEIWHGQTWQPIVRYDNAHGFCHCDTIHADGAQDKIPIYRWDANRNFTWAINELRGNWESHRARYLAEIEA